MLVGAGGDVMHYAIIIGGLDMSQDALCLLRQPFYLFEQFNIQI